MGKTENGRNVNLVFGGLYCYNNNMMTGGINSGYSSGLNKWGTILHNQSGGFAGIAVGSAADGSDLSLAFAASPYSEYKCMFHKAVGFVTEGTSGYTGTVINGDFIRSGTNGFETHVRGGDLTVKNTSGEVFEVSSFSFSDYIKLKTGNVFVGKESGYIGFFGESKKSAKISIDKATFIATSESVYNIGTKLNELIDALKAYNLIG